MTRSEVAATRRVVVVGAGPAGAAAARVLHDAGVEVCVLEAADVVGGRTTTARYDGYSIDTGAIFVMGSYRRTRAFLRSAGRLDQMRSWRARTVLRDGARTYPVRFDLPASFLRLPQLTWRDRWRLVRTIVGLRLRPGPAPFDLDSLAADDTTGETMEAWSRRVLGDRVHEYVVRPLMEPLTGADLSTISRSFLLGLLREAHRTQLTVPVDGLDRVATWQLAGVEVRLSSRVEAIRRSTAGVEVVSRGEVLTADAVVIATDARAAADLGREVLSPKALEALRGVQAIATHHVAFVFRSKTFADAAADLVVPIGAGPHSDIGVLLGGHRRPGSAPGGGQVVSVYFDGPRSADLTEQSLVPAALDVLRQVHGDVPPDATVTYHRDYGLSTAAPGHYRRMQALLDDQPVDVRLAGDYFTQSGIESAYVSGERAAADVLQGLGVSPAGGRGRPSRSG